MAKAFASCDTQGYKGPGFSRRKKPWVFQPIGKVDQEKLQLLNNQLMNTTIKTDEMYFEFGIDGR